MAAVTTTHLPETLIAEKHVELVKVNSYGPFFSEVNFEVEGLENL